MAALDGWSPGWTCPSLRNFVVSGTSLSVVLTLLDREAFATAAGSSADGDGKVAVSSGDVA